MLFSRVIRCFGTSFGGSIVLFCFFSGPLMGATVLSPHIKASLLAAGSFRNEVHLTTAVVAAIVERPDQTSAIIEEAVRLIPEKSSLIVAQASYYFPAFTTKIQTAGGVSPSGNFLTAESQSGWLSRDWAVTVYAGRLITDDTSDMAVGDFDFEDSGLVIAALSKELYWFFGKQASLGAEIQIGRHFGGQDNWEFNAGLLLRWHDFPWNGTIKTTVAFGFGISYASEKPELELRARGPDGADQRQNLLEGEIELTLPSTPDLSLVGRYHHRSDASVSDSTVLGLGMKYRF